MPSAKELAKALAYQGEIRNTSRNRLLGGVADALAPVSEFADQYKISDRIPFLGGLSAADLTGLKGAQSLVNDMSYGTPPIRGASLQTTKVDPRVLDLAGVTGAMMPVAKSLGKAAAMKAAEHIQDRTGFARLMPDTRMGIVPDGKAMSVQGLEGHPKLNVMPNKRFALVEGNSNLRVEHKPDGTFTISHSPAWGETGKPFTLNGDSVDNLISTAESRLQRSENAMTAAAKGKHSKTVGGMLEMKHGDNFEYAKSARSNSQYITHTPTGAKIRISDHKLPDVYESADFEVSNALGKKEQAQSISKFLDDYATDRAKDDASIGVGGAMIQRPKTEFEILHDTAQRNAALPVEQGGLGLPANNTYIDRANAPGMWPDDVYHATHADVDAFKPSLKGKLGAGVYVSPNPRYAGKYADVGVEGARVMPLRARGNLADKDTYSDVSELIRQQMRQEMIDQNKSFIVPEWQNRTTKALSDAGYEGRRMDGLESVITNPANIRSRFAAFDPFRRHEADILAGVGVGGMLDPQAIAEALRQQDRK